MNKNRYAIVIAIMGVGLLAGCASDAKVDMKPYDIPKPIEYTAPDKDGIKHLVNDSERLEMRGHFCYELPVEHQRPGANCIPTGGVGGASGK